MPEASRMKFASDPSNRYPESLAVQTTNAPDWSRTSRKFGAVRLGRFDDRVPALLCLEQRRVRPREQLSCTLAISPVPANPHAEAHGHYAFVPRQSHRVALEILADARSQALREGERSTIALPSPDMGSGPGQLSNLDAVTYAQDLVYGAQILLYGGLGEPHLPGYLGVG